MAERRSHSSPHLREPFWESSEKELTPTSPRPRGCDQLSDLLTLFAPHLNPKRRPSPQTHIIHANSLLVQRWRPPGRGMMAPWGTIQGRRDERGEPPWRASYGSTVQRVLKEDPRTVVMIDSLIGLVPYSLEDLSPWCRVEGSNIHPIDTRMQTTAWILSRWGSEEFQS